MDEGTGPQPVVATACFLCRDGRVLLQLRPPHLRWSGRWNGPGGKVEPGEAPEAAVAREVAEETGLRIEEPSAHGTLELRFGRPAASRLVVHVFTATRFTGRARGTAGTLRWHPRERLPWDRMWPDQRYWLPAVLNGGVVDGRCSFDSAGDRLLEWSFQLNATKDRS